VVGAVDTAAGEEVGGEEAAKHADIRLEHRHLDVQVERHVVGHPVDRPREL
jgi:hypothetical protein